MFAKSVPAKLATVCVGASLLLAGCNDTKTTVKVSSYDFDTAGNMFAYAEFELSGEPLAESLGLDLDVLDTGKLDQPTKFDYIAGIESYEYSEEAMYELVEKSGMGLHLVNGPAIRALAAKDGVTANEALASRFIHLANSVGQPVEDLQQNMYPTLIEYASGDPHYPDPVDTAKFSDGDDGAYTPKIQVDYASLRWDRAKMNKQLTPAAYGGAMLKQTLWAGDFLGNLHTLKGDEETDASELEGTDEAKQGLALGVSSADGVRGMFLTEEIWNKLLFLRDKMFYDAGSDSLTTLKKGTSAYLPHAVAVTETSDAAYADAAQLKVTDKRSLLSDQWLMLWPTSEFYAMTDQRAANPNANPAFRLVFDGDPFPKAPEVNTDENDANDVASDDPYTVSRDVVLSLFAHLRQGHWNVEHGAFVTEYSDGKQNTKVDTFQAGYTVEALRLFQRAIDGLPVGYASGEAAKGLQTELGKQALDMVKRQADFIVGKLTQADGLVASGYDFATGKLVGEPTLDAQVGAIRGLTSAFLATEDEKYRDAARSIFEAMNAKLWNDKAGVYRSAEGADKSAYSPFTAGGLSAAFRLGLLHLKNVPDDASKPKALDEETLKERYVSFYRTVINGPSLEEGMQASEFWDTGDVYKENDDSGNTDGDTVPQLQKGHGQYGIAPVLLPVEVGF